MKDIINAYELIILVKSQICRLEKILAVLVEENNNTGKKVQTKRVEKEMLLGEVAEVLGLTYEEAYELENNNEYSPDVLLKEKITRWLLT